MKVPHKHLVFVSLKVYFYTSGKMPTTAVMLDWIFSGFICDAGVEVL